MMTNLFSIFDPSTSISFLPMNWLSSIMGILMIPSMYWLIPSRYNYIWNKILLNLHKEMQILMIPNYTKGSTLILISLFSMIFFNNFMGLFPYIFTSTSHLTFTMTLSIPMWFSYIMFGWLNNMNHMFSHMIPLGTPKMLMPFMVCIETISTIIRPMTLAIRLSANMIAGHLLLTLLGNTMINNYNIMLLLLIVTQMILLTLELSVSIIQSYVFMILMALYSNEVK